MGRSCNSCDEGDDDKETNDSDEVLVAAAMRYFKFQEWQPVSHFEKLLEVTYPNHAYPVRHKLKECNMMKNYMTTGPFTKGKKPEDDPIGMAVAPFLEEKKVMSIYGGLTPHESRCKLKLLIGCVSPSPGGSLSLLTS
jgi:hypothetical protein